MDYVEWDWVEVHFTPMNHVAMVLSMTSQTPQPLQLLPIHSIMHPNNTTSHKALLRLGVGGTTLLCLQLFLHIFEMHVNYIEYAEDFS